MISQQGLSLEGFWNALEVLRAELGAVDGQWSAFWTRYVEASRWPCGRLFTGKSARWEPAVPVPTESGVFANFAWTNVCARWEMFLRAFCTAQQAVEGVMAALPAPAEWLPLMVEDLPIWIWQGPVTVADLLDDLDRWFRAWSPGVLEDHEFGQWNGSTRFSVEMHHFPKKFLYPLEEAIRRRPPVSIEDLAALFEEIRDPGSHVEERLGALAHAFPGLMHFVSAESLARLLGVGTGAVRKTWWWKCNREAQLVARRRSCAKRIRQRVQKKEKQP